MKMICISCPIGCPIEVNPVEGEIIVKGNKCPRGKIYGTEEFLAPKRVVTATCATNSCVSARIPVKTTAPIPKEQINSLLTLLYKTTVPVPARCGDVIIKNFCDPGVDVVITKSLLE